MTRNWVMVFAAVYGHDKITPYMHAMKCHVGQFLRQHGSLYQFSQQGIEKYNDRWTKMYFRPVWNTYTVVPSCVCEVLSIVKACACTWNTHACLRLVQFHLCRFTCRSTNMRGNQALLQILQKQSRLSTLTHLGVVPALWEITCSNCQGKGHHHVTCKSYCQCCRYELVLQVWAVLWKFVTRWTSTVTMSSTTEGFKSASMSRIVDIVLPQCHRFGIQTKDSIDCMTFDHCKYEPYAWTNGPCCHMQCIVIKYIYTSLLSAPQVWNNNNWLLLVSMTDHWGL